MVKNKVKLLSVTHAKVFVTASVAKELWNSEYLLTLVTLNTKLLTKRMDRLYPTSYLCTPLFWSATAPIRSRLHLLQFLAHTHTHTTGRTRIDWLIRSLQKSITPNYYRILHMTSWSACPLKMGPTGCPKMSARNYHFTLCKIPKECRSQHSLQFITYKYEYMKWKF